MPSPEVVESVFTDCLLRDEELEDGKPKSDVNVTRVEGLVHIFGFHNERLKSHESGIRQMLSELPTSFHKGMGGGWSFLNACQDKDGKQWTGLHMIMEQLFCLGMGLDLASYLLPREMWGALPGKMPYFVIDLDGRSE